MAQYVRAIIDEIKMYSPFANRYIVKTIYFGGGTPSILDESMIGEILAAVKDTFTVDRFPEITIEANPGTIRYNDLLHYLGYGINRISIGMQSADDNILKTLGRIHDFNQFLQSYDFARRAGFKNISVDIMSGVPGQTIHSFVDTLTRVTEIHPEHISCYSLQVEEGTPLASNEELLNLIPDEDTDRKMYTMTKKILESAGYRRYEISNYSISGYESRHNSVYWTGGEYIGFGISAASFFKGERYTNTTDIERYLTTMSDVKKEMVQGTDGNLLYEAASKEIRNDIVIMYINKKIEEFMFLGLRMTEGVNRRIFKERFGKDMFAVYGKIINNYTSQGFMDYDEEHVWLTDSGIDVSNYILADFLMDDKK